MDFGLVRVGQSAKRTLNLRNTSPILAWFCVREFSLLSQSDSRVVQSAPNPFAQQGAGANTDAAKQAPEYSLRIEPDSGTIRPMELFELEVEFSPKTAGSIKTLLTVEVQDGEPLYARL